MNTIKSIKIDSISMANFMSYDDFTMDNLSKYKIIFISGKNAQGKSTLTSEAPYFSLFGNPLRYKKHNQLLSWYYDTELMLPAYSQIGLVFDLYDHDVKVNIKRHLIGDVRYEVDIQNDINNDLISLKEAVRVPDFNKEVMNLLEIDEKKFTILYLKSPFSKPIFETDSDLLSSITKAEYINDIRNDFNNVVFSLKDDMKNLTTTIEKQNALAENIKKQLQEIANAANQDDEKKKLEQVILSINQFENEMKLVNAEIIKSRSEYKTVDARRIKGVEWLSQTKTQVSQLEKERDKYKKLITRGKCPTCEQNISQSLYDDNIALLDVEISKGYEAIKKGSIRLDEIKESLSSIDEKLMDNNNRQRSINDKLRTLSNMKSQLETSLKNFKDHESNNDEILKKIRNTIMDLNDEMSVIVSDFSVMDSISKIMLSKNSEYINLYYNNKIHDFNLVFMQILSKMTKGKYTNVTMKLNNRPTLNNHIEYESLSTSERKFIDLSFVVSYIVYLSTKLKLKSFILDEFFDNYDKENILHIHQTIHDIANKYDLQLFITTNMGEYIFSHMGDVEDINFITLTK